MDSKVQALKKQKQIFKKEKTVFSNEETISFWANYSEYYDKFEKVISCASCEDKSQQDKVDYYNELREIYDKEWTDADTPLNKRAWKYFYLYARKYVESGIKPERIFENILNTLTNSDLEFFEETINNPYGKLVLNRIKAGWNLTHSHKKILELSTGGYFPLR